MLALSLAVAAVILPAPAVLDFETPVESLGLAVLQLAQATGEKLQASPKIAHEIVFVRAKGVTAQDLKARLAAVLNAEWTREGATDYLGRSAKLDRKVWADHVAVRRKYVDEELARLKKELETPFDPKSLAVGLQGLQTAEEVRSDPLAARARYEKEKALYSSSPAARLLKRLLLACKPDDLAAVGPYERAVFTANPTRMQRAFDPRGVQAAWAAFNAEQQAWVDTVAATNFKEEVEGRTVSDPRSQTWIKPESTDFELNVIRGDMAALFMVNLMGKGQARERSVLTQLVCADPSRKYLDSRISPPEPKPDDPFVPLSKDAEEFYQRLFDSMRGAKVEALSPRLKEIMLDPVKFEPLELAVGDLLRAVAENEEQNVIASLPDLSIGVSMAVDNGKLKLSEGLTALNQGVGVRVRREAGWAVFTPDDRFEAATAFTPRKAMQELMRSIDAKGRLDLRDYADYAFKTGRISRMGLAEWYLVMMDRSLMGGLDRTDWNALRLYGSFSALQQRQLEEGQHFPIGAMTPMQKSIVDRIIYAGEIRSETQEGSGSARWRGQAKEPTEAFGNGLPPTGFVSATAKGVPSLAAYARDSNGKVKPLRTINAWTLANYVVKYSGDPHMVATYGMTGLVGYAPVTEKLVALRVEPAEGVWRELAMTINEFDPAAKPVPWEQLPDPWPKQIRDAIAQIGGGEG
ncbi:MAG: hypothetical protein HZC36_14485 [Armatimonadetes bacterium]|nr:hypothetical protein [Armatimonadota bacterium]